MVRVHVVSRLNEELNKVLKRPEIEEQYKTMGLVTGGGTPEQLGEFIRHDISQWAEVVRKGGIKID